MCGLFAASEMVSKDCMPAGQSEIELFSGNAGQEPNPSLTKAVARARGWYERVLEGKSSDQRSLTLHAGVTERYIGKVFGCAFLAPDIVEAILEGRQPRELSFKKLCANIPLSWAEQRKQFGFPR